MTLQNEYFADTNPERCSICTSGKGVFSVLVNALNE
jgi:hypothetical protein